MGIIRVVVFSRNDSTDNPTCRFPFLGVQSFCMILTISDEMEPLNHWSTIECQIAIICACLPIARAMLVHFFPRIFGVSTDQDSSGRPNVYRVGVSSQGAGTDYLNDKSRISKTMSVSVDYSSRPQRRHSGSLVQLVEMDSDRENSTA